MTSQTFSLILNGLTILCLAATVYFVREGRIYNRIADKLRRDIPLTAKEQKRADKLLEKERL